MYEDWESEQYENGQLFEKDYALYTLEDLLGCLPESEANLKFQPGVIKVYKESRMMLTREEKDWREYVLKHLQGEWGEVTPTSKLGNEAALEANTGDIFSAYNLDREREGITVITHLDSEFTQVATTWWA